MLLFTSRLQTIIIVLHNGNGTRIIITVKDGYFRDFANSIVEHIISSEKIIMQIVCVRWGIIVILFIVNRTRGLVSRLSPSV